MKQENTLLIAFIAVFFFFIFTNQSSGAMTSYLTVIGANQGAILGDCTQEGKEDTIVVYSFGHNIHLNRDPDTGLPTSNKIHTPLKIQKHFDKSSPLLQQSLVSGEIMITWELKFFQVNDLGKVVHYYTIRLDGARIVSITANKPNTLLEENSPYHDMETVSFIYNAITWTHEIDGIESSDTWSSQ